MEYVRKSGGDHAGFLIRLLLLLAKRGWSGVKQAEMEALYCDEKGNLPSEKTVRRAIHALTIILDPSANDEEPLFRTPRARRPIQMKTSEEDGKKVRRYYLVRMLQPQNEPTHDEPDGGLVLNLIGHKKQLLAEDFESMLSVLSAGLDPKSKSVLLDDLTNYVYVSGFSPTQSRNNLRKLLEIFRAIRRGKAVRFHYISASTGEKTTHRIVNPYGLVYRNGVWYLAGHCRESNERRIFRIDHMDRLMIQETLSFSIPAGFSLEKYYAASWGIWTESSKQPEPETVELVVAASVASHFDAICYHESQTVKRLADGSLRVRFNVAGAMEMLPWLLGWGAAVKVLEPEWLRQKLLERARDMLAQYEDKT